MGETVCNLGIEIVGLLKPRTQAREVPKKYRKKIRLQGPWVMGETYTICDPYLFTISRWLEDDGVDTGKLPRILEHRRCMMARVATQCALSQMS